MPGIGDYITWSKVVLVEGGKYFSLLLFIVLAIRLWRNGLKVHGSLRSKNISLALVTTVLAGGIGWFSIHNSLGKLYFYYGMRAFDAGRLEQAYSLFEDSERFWAGADATGGRGVCLLLLGRTEVGESCLQKAAALRKGRSSTFEQFYQGLYYFLHNEQQKALPFLQGASADALYQWSVVKFFAVMELEAGQPDRAAELMKPYLKAEVAEPDQAYIIASLDLAAGKKNEAQALVDKFATANQAPFWKSRFEKLSAKLNEH